MIELSGMIIEVKASDIREAKRISREYRERKITSYYRADSCPLAIALKRTFPDYRFALIIPYMNVSRESFIPHDCKVNECGSNYHRYLRKLVQLSEEAKQFAYEADKKKDRIKPRSVRL